MIRDKLFWFYAYDQSQRNFPGTARPSDPNDLFAPANAALPAGETCSTDSLHHASALSLSTEGDYNSWLIAALYGVSFQAGSAYYTQGLGIVQSLIGSVPRIRRPGHQPAQAGLPDQRPQPPVADVQPHALLLS